MLGSLGYVMVFVSDMARSVGFYRGTLGLELRFESDEWTEFETGATTLALHRGGAASGQGEAAGHRAGECSLEFLVADIAKTAAELESRGMRFARPPMRRENEGVIRGVCLDPDGLRISIAQRIAAPVAG